MKRRNNINYIFDYNNEEKIKEKKLRELQLKREEEYRKRNIIVNNIFDLTKKYEDYEIKIDSFSGIVILKKPLEVKYLAQLRYDCNSLGYKFCIHDKNVINSLYHY